MLTAVAVSIGTARPLIRKRGATILTSQSLRPTLGANESTNTMRRQSNDPGAAIGPEPTTATAVPAAVPSRYQVEIPTQRKRVVCKIDVA